jgi:hypothetical protein
MDKLCFSGYQKWGEKETKEESWCLFVKGLHRPYEL